MFAVEFAAGASILVQNALPAADDCMYLLAEGTVEVIIMGTAAAAAGAKKGACTAGARVCVCACACVCVCVCVWWAAGMARLGAQGRVCALAGAWVVHEQGCDALHRAASTQIHAATRRGATHDTTQRTGPSSGGGGGAAVLGDEAARVQGNELRIPQGPGWVFGDVALLFNSSRTASVVAASSVLLWAIDRATFLRFVMRHAAGARALRFVRKVRAGVRACVRACLRACVRACW
jgi:CRP-like cAMP-binding protein